MSVIWSNQFCSSSIFLRHHRLCACRYQLLQSQNYYEFIIVSRQFVISSTPWFGSNDYTLVYFVHNKWWHEKVGENNQDRSNYWQQFFQVIMLYQQTMKHGQGVDVMSELQKIKVSTKKSYLSVVTVINIYKSVFQIPKTLP